jgi:hypothetical protein
MLSERKKDHLMEAQEHNPQGGYPLRVFDAEGQV